MRDPFLCGCVISQLLLDHRAVLLNQRAIAQDVSLRIDAVQPRAASREYVHPRPVPSRFCASDEAEEHTLVSSQTWHNSGRDRTHTGLLAGGASTFQVRVPS